MGTSRRSFVQAISMGLVPADFLIPQIPARSASTADPAPRRIIPYPKFQAWGPGAIPLGPDAPGHLVLPDRALSKVRLAAEMIVAEVTRLAGPDAVIRMVSSTESLPRSSCSIYLVDFEKNTREKQQAAALLDPEDRAMLSDPGRTRQAYIVKTLPDRREVWLIGCSAQGVLYAAMTFMQLLDGRGRVAIRQAHVRDCPDFRYRAASDWLLQAEANRWAYDWGDGRSAFVKRIKRKLEFCLRFKINMVVFDGFGWISEKVPGYANLMRELNGYARERGIKLLFGGYGCNYQAALIRPEHNIGRIWYNRVSYPHGETYACFGEGNPTYREGSPTGALLGGCRGNDELNRLKAQELREFVRAVEPGALYIHHEDVGNLARMGNFADANNQLADWKTRCPRCRSRWPNDDFLAKDGGAGAIAHGYANLVEAVCSVSNEDTGYDAGKDCTIVLVSPGYSPSATDPVSWENHLVFWSNVVSLLPSRDNIEVGFREVFPQEGTGKRWLDAYNERLGTQAKRAPAFVFFLGGADLYSSSAFNYPYSAVAALNGEFLGAETIYNFSGAAFQEPLQILNGQFAWNATAPGHATPKTHRECTERRRELMGNDNIPDEIAGPNGLLPETCTRLYGSAAGSAMLRYFNHFKSQPHAGGELLMPLLPARLYPTPILWRILEMDRDWGSSPPGPESQRWIDRLGLSPAAWQERWSTIWQLYGEVNGEAGQIVRSALASPDLPADSRQDVVYLQRCLAVGRQFSLLLARYHRLLADVANNDNQTARVGFRDIRSRLGSLRAFLEKNFRFDTVDPLGGDQASWLEAILYLGNQLADMPHN